jgi:hypothetical protein
MVELAVSDEVLLLSVHMTDPNTVRAESSVEPIAVLAQRLEAEKW